MKTYLDTADRFGDLSRLRYAAVTKDDPHDSLKLESLLLQHWDAVATNPRDKIYAIFRLASDGNEYFRLTSDGDEDRLDVDYEMPVQELFTSIVKRTIELSGKLSIILPRRGPGRPEHNLPSWCPDWSSSQPASKLGNWQDVYPFQVSPDSLGYHAAGLGLTAQVRYVRYGPTRLSLVAKGFVLDDVHRISQHDPQPKVSKSRSKPPSSFWSFMDCFGFTRRQAHPPPERKLELWYTLLRKSLRFTFSENRYNRTIPHGSSSFRRFTREQHSNFFWILHRATNILSHEVPARNRSPSTRDFLSRWIYHRDVPEKLKYSDHFSKEMTGELRAVCGDMGKIRINENYTNFFVTKSGALGLGPTEMLKDDRVVVLAGCEVPVVLRWVRERERGRGSYRLIGQCYVVGAMHGEWAEKQRLRVGEDLDDWADFEIC